MPARTAAMLTTRLPASVAGADAQASVSERNPTGTPASAQTSAASRLTASLLSGSIGQAMRLMMGRRRSSSSPPATTRAISTTRRVMSSPTTSTAWKCFDRVGEDRRDLVQRPRGERHVLGGHHGAPVEAHLRQGVDEARGVGDVCDAARAQLAGVRVDDADAAAVVAQVAGRPVEHDVAARVAGGEERRLGRRPQRRPDNVLRHARDLRRAVDAAAAAFERVERALQREPHADLGQRLEDRRPRDAPGRPG